MIHSFINNKQRDLLLTFRDSDYRKPARLNLNIIILNTTRIKLSETRAMPAPLKAFRKVISCEYMCLCPFIQSLFSFLFLCVFSNLKPEPFLSLFHPWFSSQSHFSGTENSTSFWVSSNLHIFLQLSFAFSLSLDFTFYFINPSSTLRLPSWSAPHLVLSPLLWELSFSYF